MPSGLADLKPVYLIYGDQEFLLQNAIDRLRKRVIDAGGFEFDIDVFDGESASADAVLSSANMLPLMAEKRLVILKHADKLSTSELGVLADYCAAPNPAATLVLVCAKLAKNLRIYKAVDSLGGVAEYKAPSKKDFPRAVVQLFAERGKKIGVDAAEALVRAVGYDLRHVDTEINKVIAFLGDKQTLSRGDIEQVMLETAPVSVFDFLDALGARDINRALALFSRQMQAGESIYGIHAMTMRHLRNLIAVRAMLQRSDVPRNADAIARAIGVGMQAWQARNLIRQAERFTSQELVDGLRQAASLEAEMKTGRTPRLAFEMWLISVCQRKR